MFASNREGLFGKKYLLLLVASLLTTYALHRTITGTENPTLAAGHWFTNDARIVEVLREYVETNFTYIKIYEPGYVSSFDGGITPFFAEYDIWFRYFHFYPLDPETTPDDKNYRIDGVIFIDGRIKIYGLVPADTVYC